MNIGFAYAIKEDKVAGINRVIMETVKELLKNDSENNYYSVEDNYLNLPIESPRCISLSKNNIDCRNIVCYLKEIDILHSFYHSFDTVKYKCKKILTIHDLIPFIHPEWFEKEQTYIYFRDSIKRSAEMSDVVIAMSEATKNDIVSYYNIPSEKIKVVYSGLFSSLNFETTEKRIINNFSLWEGYILSVCTIEPRKNLKGLIKGFIGFKKLYPKSRLKLVLAGRQGWDMELKSFVANLDSYKDDIVFTGYLEDEDLSELYVNALAVAYVSFFEGFGLPVLEAMAAGKAVICSNTSSLPEVGGEAVLYCDPYKTDSITHAIEKLVNNDGLRHRLEKKAAERAGIFSYRKTAKEILKIYKSLS